MDKTMRINAIIRYIETHIQDEIAYCDLERAVALSYRQVRDDFRAYSKTSLKRYIVSRKVAYAAFAIETTEKKLVDIAAEYSFGAYDTFTRAFQRETGVTPSTYRKSGCHRVRHKLIAMGTYAPVLVDIGDLPATAARPGDCILYGVPKIEFTTGKCTPLPAGLESLLSYIGQRENCSYTWLMAATGIAFRLCWGRGQWDMANSDIANISQGSRWEIYERVYRAAGWTCDILKKGEAPKQEFMGRICASIARGHPVIALGVIGPPEACVITGCHTGGGSLLGWSYFQDAPEFRGTASRDASGYFVSSAWWENPSTLAMITLGQKTEPPTYRETMRRIHSVLTAQTAGIYLAGQDAYAAWASDLQDDRAFAINNITPILLSRYFCQADAETMLGEGRFWGAQFFIQMANRFPELSALCRQAAGLFLGTARIAQRMTLVRNGADQTEKSVALLCKPLIRGELAALVRQAQESEKRATEVIEKIMASM